MYTSRPRNNLVFIIEIFDDFRDNFILFILHDFFSNAIFFCQGIAFRGEEFFSQDVRFFRKIFMLFRTIFTKIRCGEKTDITENGGSVESC